MSPEANNDEAVEEGAFESLDLSGIRFPSDGISMAMLRQRHPMLFDIGFGKKQVEQPDYFFSGHAEDEIGDLLCCERQVAVRAFAAARGIAPPDEFIPADEQRAELGQWYIRLGMASGEHEAAELVRQIEQQSAALGRETGR